MLMSFAIYMIITSRKTTSSGISMSLPFSMNNSCNLWTTLRALHSAKATQCLFHDPSGWNCHVIPNKQEKAAQLMDSLMFDQ